MSHRLTEILPKDWSKLSNLYKFYGTKRYTAYNTIDNYAKWLKKDPQLKHVKFYCLNGDFSDGTFVVTDRCHAYADTLNRSQNNLSHLLGLLDYSKGYMFLSERAEVRPTILKAFERANVKLAHAFKTLVYHLPKEKALKLEAKPPKGIQLRTLNPGDDIEKVNAVYGMAYDGSPANFLRRLATYNLGAGAYKEDGTLLSWALQRQTGAIMALQTNKSYLKHGMAELIVKYISNKVGETGVDVYGDIFEENYRSRNLVEKLGFKVVNEVHWIMSKHNWSAADE